MSTTTRAFFWSKTFCYTTKYEKKNDVDWIVYESLSCWCNLSKILFRNSLFLVFIKYILILSCILFFQSVFNDIFIQFFIDRSTKFWSINKLKYLFTKFVKDVIASYEELCMIISLNNIKSFKLCLTINSLMIVLLSFETAKVVNVVTTLLNQEVLCVDLKCLIVNFKTFFESA